MGGGHDLFAGVKDSDPREQERPAQEVSGRNIAEAVAVYVDNEFKERFEFYDYPEKRAQLYHDDLVHEICTRTGLTYTDFDLYPISEKVACRELAVFVAVPTTRWNKEDYASGLWNRHNHMWRMMDKMVSHMLGRCYEKVKKAVFIASDWNPGNLERWAGSIELIREKGDVEFYLVHDGKATGILTEEGKETASGGNHSMSSEKATEEGKFAKAASEIYNALAEEKWKGIPSDEAILRSVQDALGNNGQELYVYPCSRDKSMKETAFFVCLEGVPFSMDIENQMIGGFDDTVRRIVSYTQRPSVQACRDVVLITDSWSADVFREWGENLKVISGIVNLEIYLATGKSVHRIEV